MSSGLEDARMTRIDSALAAAAAAVIALAGASAAAAGTAIDVPAQVFAQARTSAKPAAPWSGGPVLAARGRDWAVGRSYRVNLPLGAGQRLPLRVHVYSSEEECHDDAGVAARAKNQDQDFIRGGDH
jgi:hypothetical protein